MGRKYLDSSNLVEPTPKKQMITFVLLLMSATNSKMPTLTTKLNQRTNGKSQQMLCLSDSIASLRDAKTSCILPEPFCNSKSLIRSKSETPKLELSQIVLNKSMLSSTLLSIFSVMSNMIS